MRVIRASEIGSFLYCRRAWWYRQQGIEAENQAELAAGTAHHRSHSRQTAAAGLLCALGWLLLLAALATVVVELTSRFLQAVP